MSRQARLMDTLLTPVLSGVAASAISYFVYDENGVLLYFGMELPAVPAIGAVVALSSLAGNAAGNYLLPMIPGNIKFAHFEKLVFMPLLTGSANAALMYFGNPMAQNNLMRPFKIGALAEIVGQYSTDSVKPYV